MHRQRLQIDHRVGHGCHCVLFANDGGIRTCHAVSHMFMRMCGRVCRHCCVLSRPRQGTLVSLCPFSVDSSHRLTCFLHFHPLTVALRPCSPLTVIRSVAFFLPEWAHFRSCLLLPHRHRPSLSAALALAFRPPPSFLLLHVALHWRAITVDGVCVACGFGSRQPYH